LTALTTIRIATKNHERTGWGYCVVGRMLIQKGHGGEEIGGGNLQGTKLIGWWTKRWGPSASGDNNDGEQRKETTTELAVFR
jgi:hypothetical protein